MILKLIVLSISFLKNSRNRNAYLCRVPPLTPLGPPLTSHVPPLQVYAHLPWLAELLSQAIWGVFWLTTLRDFLPREFLLADFLCLLRSSFFPRTKWVPNLFKIFVSWKQKCVFWCNFIKKNAFSGVILSSNSNYLHETYCVKNDDVNYSIFLS